MKKFRIFFSLMLACTGLFAQQIQESEVPVKALQAFKNEFPTLPPGMTANWFLDKAVGSDKVFYKASWMVSGGFESHTYNMNGVKIYDNKDFYQPANAPQNVVTNMAAAYPASPVAKVSEFVSQKYNKKGYIVKYEDFKTKYTDSNGALTTVNPLNDILNTATLDASNFVAAPSGTSVSPAPAGKTPLKTTPAPAK